MKYKYLLTFIFCLCFSLASADPFKTQQSTFNFLKELYADMDYDEIVQSTIGETSHHKLYVQFFKDILMDDELLVPISSLIYDNKALLDDNPSLAAPLASTWSISTALKGVSRLSDEDQLFFIEMTLLQINMIDDKACALMIVGDSSNEELSSIGFEAMEPLPGRLIKGYLSTLKSSLLAEVRDYPLERFLSASERQVADTAFEKAYIGGLMAHDESEELITAATDPKLSNPHYICENAKVMFSSILDVEGYTGTLVVRNLLAQMY